MKNLKLVVFILEPFNGRMRYVLRHEGVAVDYFLCGSALAQQRAADKIEHLSAFFEQPSELRFRRRNGTFAPARTFPRSADPKRSKG